jgi:hypothetical protein
MAFFHGTQKGDRQMLGILQEYLGKQLMFEWHI